MQLKSLAASVLSFLLLCGQPAAQEIPAAHRAVNEDDLIWALRPTRMDWLEAYPVEARAANVAGLATLDCLILEMGALECTVLGERPANRGFGAAALALTNKYRAEPITRAHEQSAGGRIFIQRFFSPLMWGARPPNTDPVVVTDLSELPPDLISRPVWTARPTAGQIAAAYPELARASAQRVDLQLICFAGLEGLLHCEEPNLSPELEVMGFRAAARSVVDHFRIGAEDADGAPTPGRGLFLHVNLAPPQQ